MSFISNAFSGASNNFQPGNGNQQQVAQANAANANYGQANSGLTNLAQMLQAQANGQGPNPALAQLANTTGQNVSQQASLMAGQRGASSNPALIARQIAQQGANIQQQGVGQAAALRANQQLGAEGQLGSVYGTQGQLANQNYGITQQAVNYGNQVGSNQGQQNAQMNQGIIGGVANAGAHLLGFADGGTASKQEFNIGQGSNFGFNFTQGKRPGTKDPMAGASNVITDASQVPGGNQYTGMENAMVPVGAQGGSAITLPFAPAQTVKPMGALTMSQGGVLDAKRGGTIPGTPKHNYNTVKNDVVPAMLTPKEIVLPIEVTQAPDAPQKAAQFVADELRKNGEGPDDDFKGAISRGMKQRKK